jgi:PTH1 family peptidyl-tRNA hydrolase
MNLVCGLGNPGARYAHTRHNIGFLVCERLADRLGASFAQTKFSSQMAQGRRRGSSVLLLKPQTFMNRSGFAVAPAMRFHRLEPPELLVIHDDADLPTASVRLKQGGGTAGHKGLDSIQEQLGGAEFARLRYGVGRPADPRMELADFVLSPMSAEERRALEANVELAVDAIVAWLDDGIQPAMNAFNGKT